MSAARHRQTLFGCGIARQSVVFWEPRNADAHRFAELITFQVHTSMTAANRPPEAIHDLRQLGCRPSDILGRDMVDDPVPTEHDEGNGQQNNNFQLGALQSASSPVWPPQCKRGNQGALTTMISSHALSTSINNSNGLKTNIKAARPYGMA